MINDPTSYTTALASERAAKEKAEATLIALHSEFEEFNEREEKNYNAMHVRAKAAEAQVAEMAKALAAYRSELDDNQDTTDGQLGEPPLPNWAMRALVLLMESYNA